MAKQEQVFSVQLTGDQVQFLKFMLAEFRAPDGLNGKAVVSIADKLIRLAEALPKPVQPVAPINRLEEQKNELAVQAAVQEG